MTDIVSIVYDKRAGEYKITTRDVVTGQRQITMANHLTEQERIWARANCMSRNETPYTISWTTTSRREGPAERTRRAVYATGNKWAIENFDATH